MIVSSFNTNINNIETLENTEGAIKNRQFRKLLAAYGTQDEEKQNKNTTQYVLDNTKHESSYKQLEV